MVVWFSPFGRDRLYFRDGSEEKRDKVGFVGKSSKLSFPGFVGNLLIELSGS